MESEYGGVRQRWLLVESQERARMEEASLQQRIARSYWGLVARENLILLVHNHIRSRVLLKMAGVEL